MAMITELQNRYKQAICGREQLLIWHSHNYLTLRELLDSKYYKMSILQLQELGLDPYFFKTMVPDLLKFGNPDDIRIVYWFDN